MKISIVGIHYIHQIMNLNKEKLDLNNQIEDFSESFDDTLIKLAHNLHNNNLDVSLIANFSPAPAYMMALSALEKEGIKVYPDLQDDMAYHLSINTLENAILFDPNLKLDLAGFQFEIIKKSDYILTNQGNFEMLSYINEHSKENIIVYDCLPVYRALPFIQGVALVNKPKDFDQNVDSLMQGGLSWIAYGLSDKVVFKTLKHQISLNFKNVDAFLSEFLSLKENEIVAWLTKNKC